MTYVHIPGKPDEKTAPMTPAAKEVAKKSATSLIPSITSKPEPLASPSPMAEAKAMRVPLSQIFVDHDWNSRSRADTLRVVNPDLAGFDAESESTGLGGEGEKAEPGLIDMIREQGQLDPIDLRPNPNKAKAEKWPFVPMSGYRRLVSLTAIADEGVKTGDLHPIKGDPSWNAKDPTVWAIVRPVSETHARIRNLNENTGQKLSTPDLAFGINELRIAAKAEGRDLQGKDIAREIGKSKTIVSQLLKIMTLPKKITKHWREGGKAIIDNKEVVATSPLGISLMYELTNVEGADVQEREYAKLLSSVVPKDKKGSSPESKKFDSALKKAAYLGELLGWFAECVNNVEKPTPSEWETIANELVCFTRPAHREGADKRPPTEAQMTRMIEAMKAAFKEERIRINAPEDGADDEDEEAAERTRAKRDSGR